MKQLYQLYVSSSDWLYKENSTDYILTLDNLADVLADEVFNEIYDHLFESCIESYIIMPPNIAGQISVKLTCRDDFVSRELVLVPVHGFIS